MDIEGHTDNVGSETSIMKLSEQLAEAAKQSLIQKVFVQSLSSATGFGELQSVVPNTRAESWAQNRRIA